ncbi:hypothetical protein TNCV_1720421 [Trichonephila clavipes]|nr:hypothetical protein TNCV_1720421 [Trichonephila clavipes]
MTGQRVRSPTTKNCAPQATAVCGCGERQPTDVQWKVSARGSLLRVQGIPSARSTLHVFKVFYKTSDPVGLRNSHPKYLSTPVRIELATFGLRGWHATYKSRVD